MVEQAGQDVFVGRRRRERPGMNRGRCQPACSFVGSFVEGKELVILDGALAGAAGKGMSSHLGPVPRGSGEVVKR